jgi:hypothetical protein
MPGWTRANWKRDHRKQHGTGIDRLVYALYGLTPAEIKLVEGALHS